MSKNVYVFLAEGFEEIEAIGTIDLLRRAGLPTHVVAVGLEPNVTGAHGIAIHADLSISEVYSTRPPWWTPWCDEPRRFTALAPAHPRSQPRR